MHGQGTEWLRFCGALGMILSCFSGILPLSILLAFFVAFLLLGTGGDELVGIFLQGDFIKYSFATVLRECSLGVLLSLPACLCCWGFLLFSHWIGQSIAPARNLWVSEFGPWKNSDYSRLKNLIVSLILLGGIGFVPVFSQFLLALTETMRQPTLLGLEGHPFSTQLVSASLRIAWTAAFGLALPILSLSLAFDCGIIVFARYLRPIGQDSAFQGLKILLLCSALFASLYSFTEFSPSLGAAASSPLKLQSLMNSQEAAHE